jgi:spermidine synthase
MKPEPPLRRGLGTALAELGLVVDDGAPVRPYVREELDAVSLHFSIGAIQSRMQIQQPDALALDYTRTMMAFLLFHPKPGQIGMIGLGGGSLAKFCLRHLPNASVTVAELNPHVIALRERFAVPPDGPRLRVLELDGADFVRDTDRRFDVLLVDAFDAQGMPENVGTRRFYDDCHDALAPDGMLVVNLHAAHPHAPLYVDRLRQAFDGRVLAVDDRDGANRVVFAARATGWRPGPGLSTRRPAALDAAAWRDLRGAFARVVNAAAAAALRSDP